MQCLQKLIFLLLKDKGVNRVGDAIGFQRHIRAIAHFALHLMIGAIPMTGGREQNCPNAAPLYWV